MDKKTQDGSVFSLGRYRQLLGGILVDLHRTAGKTANDLLRSLLGNFGSTIYGGFRSVCKSWLLYDLSSVLQIVEDRSCVGLMTGAYTVAEIDNICGGQVDHGSWSNRQGLMDGQTYSRPSVIGSNKKATSSSYFIFSFCTYQAGYLSIRDFVAQTTNK